MKKPTYLYRILLFILLLATGCTAAPISPPNTPSTLDPRGPGAAQLASLWWVMLAFGTAIYVLVLVLLFAAILRRRRATSETTPDGGGGDTGRRWPIWGGIALPVVILGIVFGYSTYSLAAVQKLDEKPTMEIEVIGRRWWWEVKYPAEGITTANEIHIPVGTAVRLKLESADVIHSFWVPELHGKMDLIPTRINSLTIQADHAGVFRGECAEFCGLQHAHMGLMVVAQESGDFANWISAQQQPAQTPSEPAAAQGQKVFVDSGCVFCHTVRGLQDKPVDRSAIDLGPDLTHLSSRLTIAGASLTTNEGNLAGWVVDPQHVKPGALMPSMYLKSEDLQTLLAYLATLK